MNPDDDRRAPRLDHENLDAYQRALDFLRIALRIVAALLAILRAGERAHVNAMTFELMDIVASLP